MRRSPGIIFALLRGVHDAVDQPGCAAHSAEFQALELKRAIDPIAVRLTHEGGAAAIQHLSRGENGSAAVVADLQQMMAELEA
jgi:hypothetical protein